MITAVDTSKQERLGSNGFSYCLPDGTYCAHFMGCKATFGDRAFNASCLRRWIRSILLYHGLNRESEAIIALGEAITNAFRHCVLPNEEKAVVLAQIVVEHDKSGANVAIGNICDNCPSLDSELPEWKIEDHRGIAIIKGVQDDNVITDVKYDAIELAGVAATRFSCYVPLVG